MTGSARGKQAVYTLRADRAKLTRLTELAAREHQTLVQRIRLLIDQEIARLETADEAEAA